MASLTLNSIFSGYYIFTDYTTVKGDIWMSVSLRSYKFYNDNYYIFCYYFYVNFLFKIKNFTNDTNQIEQTTNQY